MEKYNRHSFIDKMLLAYFGDAVAYHSEKRQEAINRVLQAIKTADQDKKIAIVAHS